MESIRESHSLTETRYVFGFPDVEHWRACIHDTDMSQGCSQGYKPKRGPQMAQNENIPKQRKYKYFTSQKCDHQKLRTFFYQIDTSHHRKYFTPKYFTSQQQVFLY